MSRLSEIRERGRGVALIVGMDYPQKDIHYLLDLVSRMRKLIAEHEYDDGEFAACPDCGAWLDKAHYDRCERGALLNETEISDEQA